MRKIFAIALLNKVKAVVNSLFFAFKKIEINFVYVQKLNSFILPSKPCL